MQLKDFTVQLQMGMDVGTASKIVKKVSKVLASLRLLYRWGAVEPPGRDCGAPNQTIRHIREDCPIRSFQESWSDLMMADVTALTWIGNLDINI